MPVDCVLVSFVNAQAFAPPPPATLQDVADPFRSALEELVGIGMELARRVRDELEGQAAEATVAFERVARAVRRTIRMARWLDELMPASDALARVAARKHIIRSVEDRIDRTVDEERADCLHAELLERLDSPDMDDDIAGRPVGEIIADIARDLGLDNWSGHRPWVRRRPADVAALHARAAAAVGTVREVAGPGLRLGRRYGPPRDDGPEMDDEALARMLVSAPFRGGT